MGEIIPFHPERRTQALNTIHRLVRQLTNGLQAYPGIGFSENVIAIDPQKMDAETFELLLSDFRRCYSKGLSSGQLRFGSRVSEEADPVAGPLGHHMIHLILMPPEDPHSPENWEVEDYSKQISLNEAAPEWIRIVA